MKIRNVVFIVGAILALSVSSYARDSIQKQFVKNFKWKGGLGYYSSSNKTDSEDIFNAGIKGKSHSLLTSKILVKSELNMTWKTGHSQSKLGRDDYETGIDFEDVYVKYAPFQFLTFRAGAINQDFLKAPLLISGRPFPAVQAEIGLLRGTNRLSLKGQRAIPTSRSLDSQRTQKENTPALYTGTLDLTLRPASNFKFNAYASYFEFVDLPSKVAYESSRYGNSVLNPVESNSKFEFEFKGYAVGINTAIKFIPIELSFKALQVENQEAPGAFSMGRLFELGIGYNTDNSVYKLSGERFFNESDSSPAYYNSGSYGHSNAEGFGTTLSYFDIKNNYKVGLSFQESTPIDPNLYTSRQKSIMLSLETLYDSF